MPIWYCARAYIIGTAFCMAGLCYQAFIHTTNFYTTNCKEQCPNNTSRTGIISLVLKPSKTSFVPCHTTTEKGIAYIRPFDLTLPLRLVEIEFKNNRCCLEVCNTSDSTVEFQHSHEVAYFDARSKGLVQINNSNISQLISTYTTE